VNKIPPVDPSQSMMIQCRRISGQSCSILELPAIQRMIAGTNPADGRNSQRWEVAGYRTPDDVIARPAQGSKCQHEIWTLFHHAAGRNVVRWIGSLNSIHLLAYVGGKLEAQGGRRLVQTSISMSAFRVKADMTFCDANVCF